MINIEGLDFNKGFKHLKYEHKTERGFKELYFTN